MLDPEFRMLVCNQWLIDQLGLPDTLMASQPLYNDILMWQWRHGAFEGDIDAWSRQLELADVGSGKPRSCEQTRPNGTVPGDPRHARAGRWRRHYLHRHHAAQALRGRTESRAGGGRSRRQREIPLPRHHESRDPLADERHARRSGNPQPDRAGRGSGAHDRDGADLGVRSAGGAERYPGLLEDRGGRVVDRSGGGQFPRPRGRRAAAARDRGRAKRRDADPVDQPGGAGPYRDRSVTAAPDHQQPAVERGEVHRRRDHRSYRGRDRRPDVAAGRT